MRGFSTDTIIQILESRKRLLEEVGAKFFPIEKFTPPPRSIYEHNNSAFPPPMK